MMRCSAEAYSICPFASHCAPRAEATFMEGSECDAFNQRIDNAIEKIMRSEDESETTEGSNARGVDAKWIWRTKQMTIDRAIEILNPEHRECYDGIDEVNEACRMGMEALERTRWIPCSERLPELQDTRWVRTVIVCARGHVMPMIYERDIVQGKAVGVWKWMWRGIFNELEAITHWMPLPEPPVKDGAEIYVSFADDSDFTGGSKP